ncbi:hypothetical protein MettiDRAFT_2892 [Methanolobus tindarius DSM 2278]|uniref:EF-hand domain-containing protein n=1 Tax=Methanolobus tindarius DSM 2278 TaxID=1090322 RepID=W9DUB2_METTI|nr:hypothetical protein [Methanolobus tindarius]ETA69393.1 hypothetical protein MettiDRAFT_2892 [Methanolobus tindarius DSM 2278]
MKSTEQADLEILGFFRGTNNFSSLKINPIDESKYTLQDLEYKEVEQLRNIIIKLEQNENIVLCARGDSKESIKEHDEFINSGLVKCFVVGEKAQFYFQSALGLDHICSTKNKKNKLEEIERLRVSVNKEIQKSSSRDMGKVDGQFSCKLIDYLQNQEMSVIESWNIFLHSLLHNQGNNVFKPYSYFISLTHGNKKYKTARYFALKDKENETKKDIGVVFVYILDKNKNKYISASELLERSKEHNVKWYPDVDNEIMVIGALWPHNIIGFFEVEDEKVNRFILNYWFYKEMKSNHNHDFSQGVHVDQGDKFEKFQRYANDLKLTHISQYYSDNGEQYILKIDKLNVIKVPDIDFEDEF